MTAQIDKKAIVDYLKFQIEKWTEEYNAIEEEKDFGNSNWNWAMGAAGNLELLLDHIKAGKFDAKAD